MFGVFLREGEPCGGSRKCLVSFFEVAVERHVGGEVRAWGPLVQYEAVVRAPSVLGSCFGLGGRSRRDDDVSRFVVF